MLDIVTNLISDRNIPALNELQMEALLHHLLTATSTDTRIQVAEVACRHDREHPRAMDVFLASALPLAERSARRRAARIFVHPSDLQIELMYGGASPISVITIDGKSSTYRQVVMREVVDCVRQRCLFERDVYCARGLVLDARLECEGPIS